MPGLFKYNQLDMHACTLPMGFIPPSNSMYNYNVFWLNVSIAYHTHA